MEHPKRKDAKLSSRHKYFYPFYQHEDGFTYIELIISLSVLCFLLPSVFLVAHTVEMEIKKMVGTHRLKTEYVSFMNWVQEEIKQGKEFRTDGQQALIFDMPNGDQIQYQLKGRRIVRSVKVNGEKTFQGHTILMNHVYLVVFIPERNGVTFDIGLQNWHTSLEVVTTVSGRSDMGAITR